MKFALLAIIFTLTSCAQLGLSKSPNEKWSDIDEGISKNLEKGYGNERIPELHSQLDDLFDGKKCTGPSGNEIENKYCLQARSIITNSFIINRADYNLKAYLTTMISIQSDLDDKIKRSVENYTSYLDMINKGIAIYENIYKEDAADILKDNKFPLKKSAQFILSTFTQAKLTSLKKIKPLIENASSLRNKANADKEQNIKRCEGYEKSIDDMNEEHKTWQDHYDQIKRVKDQEDFKRKLEGWGERYQKTLYDKKWKGCPSNKLQ
ncbi:MAG: hypothetical protein Q7U04_17645 [Bacteriovorax sp.]|nr:hypothetical protein [Bacteriovorax sp.]